LRLEGSIPPGAIGREINQPQVADRLTDHRAIPPHLKKLTSLSISIPSEPAGRPELVAEGCPVLVPIGTGDHVVQVIRRVIVTTGCRIEILERPLQIAALKPEERSFAALPPTPCKFDRFIIL